MPSAPNNEGFGISKHPNASAGVPSLYFIGDEGTGVGSSAASTLDFYANYTKLFTVGPTVITIPTSKTLAVTSADGLTVGGIIVPQYVVINHKLNPANTSGEFVFIADRAYTVVSIKEIHNVVAGQACACSVRKLTTAGKLASDAIGTGVIDLLAADLDMTSTAATTVTATLTATTADRNLAAGDRIGIKMGNATSLVGGVVTIVLKAV